MAAEVDFGDLELFEAFDHPEESILKPIHTRFKDDDGDEEDENGVGDAELRERLRQCEETIERLRAENILPVLRVLSSPRGVGAAPRQGAGGNSKRARIRSNFSRTTGGLRMEGSGCASCVGASAQTFSLAGISLLTRPAPLTRQPGAVSSGYCRLLNC
ncbi:zinc finger CCHC domain-containing protein 8-like isoform X1 [Otolemur garnettii]|uniref:zinc finger CCHC domain-containing protein 8-like isoform X1 n=1 Tax=Otolemur garnettii TaxID=30611 RepID=UPI000C7EFCFF|nr:zinc finger CCHC domain-containing protein 8-like isoform X1 [Otolemur garnettii]